MLDMSKSNPLHFTKPSFSFTFPLIVTHQEMVGISKSPFIFHSSPPFFSIMCWNDPFSQKEVDSLISAIYYFFLLTHYSHLTALSIPSICLLHSKFIFIKHKFDHVMIPASLTQISQKPTNQITKDFVKFVWTTLHINLYYT